LQPLKPIVRWEKLQIHFVKFSVNTRVDGGWFMVYGVLGFSPVYHKP
jgi:hypothetical protein